MQSAYYVSVVRDRSSYRLLLGPYATQEAAELVVELGRALAINYDQWCAFDTFGTARIDRPDGAGFPVGIFGKV